MQGSQGQPCGGLLSSNPLPMFPMASSLGSGALDTAKVIAGGQPASSSSSVPNPTALTDQLEGMLGLATLPPKLTKCIVNKEYIDRFKILPKS